MTTNIANNFNICYLIIVVPQCMYLRYKFSSPFGTTKKKKKKGRVIAKKKKKKEEDIVSHPWSAPHPLRGAGPVASCQGAPRRASSGLFETVFTNPSCTIFQRLYRLDIGCTPSIGFLHVFHWYTDIQPCRGIRHAKACLITQPPDLTDKLDVPTIQVAFASSANDTWHNWSRKTLMNQSLTHQS